MKPNLKTVKKVLWEVVTKKVLTGAHGPLPKGVIPVPCLNTKGGIPPKWKSAFTRYKAKGKLDDWHTFISQISAGAKSQIVKQWPDSGRALVEKVWDFTCDVEEYLDPKYSPPRIASEAAVHFTIITSWVLREKPVEDSFASLLYRCYSAGGAPCGWLGRYPKGRLIVYWPHKQEPEFE